MSHKALCLDCIKALDELDQDMCDDCMDEADL